MKNFINSKWSLAVCAALVGMFLFGGEAYQGSGLEYWVSGPPPCFSGSVCPGQTDINGNQKVIIAGGSGSGGSPAIPSGATGETNNSKGSLISTATTVQIFAAAGAGNYHHAWIDCINGGATQTEVQIIDGASNIVADFWLGNAVSGLSDAKPVPIFGCTSNSTLSIKVLTAGASITWNARGYYSANQF